MLVSINDPIIGALTVAGNPIKLSGVLDPATRRAPPALDADRAAILALINRQSVIAAG
jgi:CoA:oxalate CoA-transferase